MLKVYRIVFCLLFCVNINLSAQDSAQQKWQSKYSSMKINYKSKLPENNKIQADEVWSWVMQGKENELDYDYPVTDIGYFAAEVNSYGELDEIPDRSKIAGFSGRVHLVLVCSSKSLTHFVLDPKYGITEKMIQDIMKAAESFDGINVDYELIPERDGEHFINFLKEIGKRCHENEKMFTVCVPARIKTISDDVFPYEKIAEISDRVMIMAYDEHWSTSKPGAIASFDWCKKIVAYANTVIPHEKIVMGLPFYGRSWTDEKLNKAWYWEGVNRILLEKKSGKKVKYINGVPTADFFVKQKVHFWFEDLNSIVAKLQMYKDNGVNKFAFWRIGQEDIRIWQWIDINKKIDGR